VSRRALASVLAAGLCACLLVQALPTALHAQGLRATLRGRVVDATSTTVVVGADVRILNTDRGMFTDDDGGFEFGELTPGAYVIEVRQPGYVVHQDTVALVAGESLEVRFSLGVDAIPLEPITVVARSNVQDQAMEAARRFDGMTRPEIETVLGRVGTMADLLRQARTPGVSIVEYDARVCAEHGRTPRRSRDGFGRDRCRPMAVYLDGVRQLLPEEALKDIDPQTVERFEILGPMQGTILYGSDAESGIIVIETQRGGRRLAEPLVLYAHDQARLRLAFAFTGNNPASTHDGFVLLSFPGGSSSSLYEERSAWRTGARVSADTRVYGYHLVRLSVFGISGSSTGRYGASASNGQLPASQSQTRTRSHTTVGLDLGYRPRLKGGDQWDLRFEIGPTLVWQRIALSQGHADEWADPTSETPPAIRWSDRRWTSVGAQAGLELSWMLSRSWAATAGARIRALYYGDAQSWEFQETEDVLKQTGNVVFFDYYQPVAFGPAFEIGMTWRR